jgi:hypothetical protein
VEAPRSLVVPKVPADRSTPCSGCEHTDFIHSDYDARACLFSGCECPSFLAGLPGPARPDGAAIVATKRGNTITLALSAGDSIERAATLARLGWSVRVARAD